MAHLARLEAAAGSRLGDPARPLLVSVRSGARVSMPGMMDTVLNLGLNDKTVEGLARWTRNERFAWDCYRRFITHLRRRGARHRAARLRRAPRDAPRRARAPRPMPTCRPRRCASWSRSCKKVVQDKTGRPFPQDPHEQLRLAINAVFDSWFAKKAVDYRRIHRLPDDWGTAVTVMAMVFGNLGDDLGHRGVLLARSLERRAALLRRVPRQRPGRGRRGGHPHPRAARGAQDAHARGVPRARRDQGSARAALPRHAGHRVHGAGGTALHPADALRQADGGGGGAHRGGDGRESEKRLDPGRPRSCGSSRPRCTSCSSRRWTRAPATPSIATGLPATPAAAVGKVVFDPERAVEMALREEAVILVRAETSPEDVAGMHAAQGVLTSRGGLTSHAAVVARGWGKCCVVGAGDVVVDEEHRLFRAGRAVVREGQVITLNGATGEVIVGALPLVDPKLSGEFRELLGWAAGARDHHGSRQRRHARGRGQGPRVRRGGHRPGAHRAHVLRGRAHPDRARHDHGERRPGPEEGGRPAAAVPARGLHRHLPASWRRTR